MSTNESSGNTLHSVAHLRAMHQFAAMQAALLVRFQYSRESKILFHRECLNHLKESLAHGQEASA